MAIIILIQLAKLINYVAFYSSLLTSARMDTITWDELFALVLDQEERLIKQTSGPNP